MFTAPGLYCISMDPKNSSRDSTHKRGFFSRFNVFQRDNGQNAAKQAPHQGHELLAKWISSGTCDHLRRALRQKADISNAQMLKSFQTTALHVAAQQGLEALTILFAEGVRSDSTPNSAGQLAIHAAAAAGNEDAVVYLLKNLGSSINARDAEGRTPCMLAVMHDHLAVVSALLVRGADILRMRDLQGQATLHYICSAAMLQYVMVNSAVPIDLPTEAADQTLLFLAADSGRLEVVRCCLSAGANPNRVDTNNQTALHRASVNGHDEVVRELLLRGASGTIVDKEGYTPVELALVKQHVTTADLFYHFGSVFTKRQLLLYSILTREAHLVRALEKEAHASEAKDEVSSLSQTLKQASHHPYLRFEPCKVAPQPLQSTPRSLKALLDELELIKDPVPRPPGAIASVTLNNVFSNMLRHSLSVPRPAAPQLPAPVRRSMGAATATIAPNSSGSNVDQFADNSAATAEEPLEASASGNRRNSLERMLPHYLRGLSHIADAPASPATFPAAKPGTASAALAIDQDFAPVFAAPGAPAVPPLASSAPGETEPPAADIINSLFFKQGKISHDSQRSNSFPSDMSAAPSGSKPYPRRVFSAVNVSTHRRRDPWGGGGAHGGDGDGDKDPPRHLRSMPQRQTFCGSRDEYENGYRRGFTAHVTAIDLDQLHAQKVEGMADFEDMMARRLAVFMPRSRVQPERCSEERA